MKSAHRNLTACILLALAFGGSSTYLARENATLRKQITSIKPSSSNSPSPSSPARTRSTRKKTLADFLAKHRQPKTAKELLWQLILASQSEISPKPLISEIYLPQLTAGKLAQLRLEISTFDCPASYRHQMLELIAIAESRFLKDSPEALFDHLISTSGIYDHFRADFSNWAKTDPQAAIAWFTSKDAHLDFQNGKIIGSENRNNLFAALLEGLAQTDLATAIEVIENETNSATKRNIPWSVIQKIIQDAQTSESDDLAQRLLKAHPSAIVQSDDPFSSANFWTELTRATGDLDRSVSLLNSLEKDERMGIAMAQIIEGKPGFTFQEKADWLTESLPNPTDFIDSFAVISPAQNSLSEDWGPVNPEAIQWLENHQDGGLKNSLLTSLSEVLTEFKKHSSAYQLGVQITEPTQRLTALQEIARNWIRQDPDQATQNLPADLLKSLTE